MLHIFSRQSLLLIAGAVMGVCVLFTSCGKDAVELPEPDDKTVTAGDDEEPSFEEWAINGCQITMLMRVPSTSRPGSRATLPFDIDRENRIDKVSVVFFHRNSEGGDSVVAMVSPAKSLERDTLNSSVYRFKVSFYPADPDDLEESFNAVILANSENEVAAVTHGMTYQEMRRALVRRFTSGASDFTPGLPADDLAPLPLWGEIADVKFPKMGQSTTPSYASSLLRAVARVDVTVDSSITPEDFELVSVSMVNGANSMMLLPDSSSLEPDPIRPDHFHAIAPSVPEEADYTVRWDYDSTAIDNNISHTVYIPESDVIMGGTYGDVNHDRRTAIVVGGRWHGADSVSYYRMDFLDNEADTLVDIRRNHLYTFRITRVDRAGAESVMDAYRDPVAGLGADLLLEWDLPDHAFTYSGDEWLSASREELRLTGNASVKGGGMETGAVIDVTSSMPLTTLRIGWVDGEDTVYHRDIATDDDAGVEATLYVNGDKARIAVTVVKDNPCDGTVRTTRLAVRISSQLSITIPVTVYPVPCNDWDGSTDIDGRL